MEKENVETILDNFYVLVHFRLEERVSLSSV